MYIEGRYKDVLTANWHKQVIMNTGWKSNSIVKDFGLFLAALMKKDIPGDIQQGYLPVGIDFIAVGNGSGDYQTFKSRIIEYFQWENFPGPYHTENYWVWAKAIDQKQDIHYLDVGDKITDTITDRLKIDICFPKDQPGPDTFVFSEFALLGISKKQEQEKIIYDPNNMYLVNYVRHGEIVKDKSMELNRTIKLTFPLQENSIKEET